MFFMFVGNSICILLKSDERVITDSRLIAAHALFFRVIVYNVGRKYLSQMCIYTQMKIVGIIDYCKPGIYFLSFHNHTAGIGNVLLISLKIIKIGINASEFVMILRLCVKSSRLKRQRKC